MNRRKVAVGVIILLLVGVNVSGDIETKEVSTTSFDGNTLYVGGSGPNNYTKIQDAIDNASDGDTVFVYSGFYDKYNGEEDSSVLIDKGINLLGEDKNTTIIDGGKINHV